MAWSDFLLSLLRYDTLTFILGAGFLGTLVFTKWAFPSSLVHPILLGRQSDVGRVRKQGESAIYRNYGVGHGGRLPVRPHKDVKLLGDLLKPDFKTPRNLWGTKITNDQIKERVSALSSAFVNIVGLTPKEANVLILLNDSLDWLITDLALAQSSIASFTTPSLRLLVPLLDTHPPSAIVIEAHFVPTLLETLTESHDARHHTVIVRGEDPAAIQLLQAQSVIKWFQFEKIESEAALRPASSIEPPQVSDAFTAAFYEVQGGQPQGAQLTHENVTSGVLVTRAFLPIDKALSPSDTVYSAYPLATPFGRAIAYAALYEGTNFSTLNSTLLVPPKDSDVFETMDARELPPPTVLFVTNTHLKSITSSILAAAQEHKFYNFAARHKLAQLVAGYLSNTTFWDRALFNKARDLALGPIGSSLRAVIVSGKHLIILLYAVSIEPPRLGHVPNDTLTPTRLALSINLVASYIHPLVCGAVFASHPLDLQSFANQPKGPNVAQVGPPAANVEVKLVNVDEADIESGENPSGELLVRGPSVGRPVPVPEGESDEWVRTGTGAVVRPNGTFQVYDI
ncbi:hypothetical protein SISSUDRAFT_977041 [Sistotremastrum suecicum HHB10207 ss-3]|uniref:AMP-dependent synthetase/ligase domain-containing protein n=1 Tax=Sistotremastrum suecicum HHB10207 ss-3 TaxID=1314776 RepID=A0A166IW48_9AGAM|nr:hypothetical protein SISSUDRAFT_977041 [Sistotremastrum suecicum HHB10207 ss-3]